MTSSYIKGSCINLPLSFLQLMGEPVPSSGLAAQLCWSNSQAQKASSLSEAPVPWLTSEDAPKWRWWASGAVFASSNFAWQQTLSLFAHVFQFRCSSYLKLLRLFSRATCPLTDILPWSERTSGSASLQPYTKAGGTILPPWTCGSSVFPVVVSGQRDGVTCVFAVTLCKGVHEFTLVNKNPLL